MAWRQRGKRIAARLQRWAHARQQSVEVANGASPAVSGDWRAFAHQFQAHGQGEGRA